MILIAYKILASFLLAGRYVICDLIPYFINLLVLIFDCVECCIGLRNCLKFETVHNSKNYKNGF